MEKIKAFSILRVRMTGFKRFKETYEVELDKVTYVSGANGQGKTSIADAIAYAFCGTPVWGEKTCDRLQNAECKEMRVEVDFVDQDGEVHSLIRRKVGNNTTIMLDKVQVRQLDLTSVFADKDIFLSVFNPLYFIEKIAEGGRELLMKLLPVIDEKDILAQMSESTQALLENESLLDPMFYIKKKREELKEIDESVTYFEGQIDLLKAQQREAAEKVDGVIAKGEKIIARKTELEEKQFNGIDVEALKSRQAKIAENLSGERKTKLIEKQAEAQNRQYKSKFADEIAKVKAEIEALSNRCKTLTAQAKGIKLGDKCPTCHTVVTEANYQSIIAGIKALYDEAYKKGQGTMQAYKELLELDEKSKAKFEEFRAEDLKRIEAELAELSGSDVSEIAMLEDRIRLGNLTEEEFAELNDLIKQADAYAVEVNALAEADNATEKIAQIEKSLKASQTQKIDITNLIHAAGEFVAKKAELTFNQLKMNRASIKLIDVVKTTGEVKDVFKFTYDGKDYRWLSTSEKIKAGLEVANLLARLTKLNYPTYIDNAECITTGIDSIHGQLIAAFARNTQLTVIHPHRQNVQMKEAA